MGKREDDLTTQHSDAPPDELEPGEVIEAELGGIVRHPRAETARLKRLADEAEHGTAPFIEMALVALRIVPLVALFVWGRLAHLSQGMRLQCTNGVR